MAFGGRLWGMKKIEEFIGSKMWVDRHSFIANYGADMVKYIKDNSVLNLGRRNNEYLPRGFEGFFYSERGSNTSLYFGFVNLNMPSESFYIILKKEARSNSQMILQRLYASATAGNPNDWGGFPAESAVDWGIPNVWDITDLVINGSTPKRGLFINWPLDPPRIER